MSSGGAHQVPGIVWNTNITGQYVSHMPPLLSITQRESDDEELEGTYSCVYSWGYGSSANYGTQAARWKMVGESVREQAWKWVEVTVMSPFLFEKQTWDADMFLIACKMDLFGKFVGDKMENNAVTAYSSFLTENRFGLQDDSFHSAGIVYTILSVFAPIIQIATNETFDFRTMCYLVKLANLEQSFFKKYCMSPPSSEPNSHTFINYEFTLSNHLPRDEMEIWITVYDQLCIAYKQCIGLEYKKTKNMAPFILIHSVIARITLQMISNITVGNRDIEREMKERIKITKKLLKLKSYGNSAFNLRKYNNAHDQYTTTIKRYPYHAMMYANRCKSSIWLANSKLARADGLRVVILHPKDAKSYHRYAEALILNKRYDEARCVCRKGLNFCKKGIDQVDLELLIIKANEQSKGLALSADDKELARIAFRDAWMKRDLDRSPDNRVTFSFNIGRSSISEKTLDEFKKNYPYVSTGKEQPTLNEIVQNPMDNAAGNNHNSDAAASKKKNQQKGTANQQQQVLPTSSSSSAVPTTNGRSTKGINQQLPETQTTKSRSSSTSKTSSTDDMEEVKSDAITTNCGVNNDVEQVPEPPVVVTAQAKLVNLQTIARNAMKCGNYTEAVRNYSLAITLSNEEEQSLQMSRTEKHLLEYATNVCMLESSNPKTVKETLSSFEHLTTCNTQRPMFYYQLAKAYYILNEFADALKPLQEGMKKSVDLGVLKWPGSDETIKESDVKECSEMMKELLKEIKLPPQPLAICRYEDCSTDYSRPQMYLNDLGFEGYVQIECDWGCHISFHLKCWNKKKANCLQHLGLNGDKDVLELECITDGCNGKIGHMIKFNAEAVAQFQVQATRCDVPKPRKPSTSKCPKTRTSKCERNLEERRKKMLNAKDRKRVHKKKDKSFTSDLETNKKETKKDGEVKVELKPDDRDVVNAQVHMKNAERAQTSSSDAVKSTPSKHKEKKHHQQRMDLSTFMNTAEDRQQYDEGLRSGAGSRHGSQNEDESQQLSAQQQAVDQGAAYQTGMEGHLSGQEAVQMVNVTSAIGELLDEGPMSRIDPKLDEMFQRFDDETKSFVNRKFGDIISLMESFNELYAVDENFIGLHDHAKQIKELNEKTEHIEAATIKEIANVDSDFDFSTDDDDEMSGDEDEEIVAPPAPTFQAPSVARPSYPMPSFETTDVASAAMVVESPSPTMVEISPPPGLEQVVRQQSVDENISSKFPSSETSMKQQPSQQVTAEEVNQLLQRIKEYEGMVTEITMEKDAVLNREYCLNNQIKEKDEVFNNLLQTCKTVEEEKVRFKQMAEQAQLARQQLDKQFETQKKAFETQLRSLQEAHDTTSAENRQLQQDCIQMKNITETLGSTNRVMMEEKVRLHQLCKDSHVKLLEMAKSLRNIEISAKVEIGRQLATIISQFYMKYDQQFVHVCVRDLRQSVDNLTAILDNAKQWFDKHIQEVTNDRLNENFLEDKNLTHRPVSHDFFKPFVSFQNRMLHTIEEYANSGRGNVPMVDSATQSDQLITSPPQQIGDMLNGNRTTATATTTSSNLHKVMKELQSRFPQSTSKELALSVWQVRQQMSHETINTDNIINRVTINIYRSKTSNNACQNLPRTNDYSRQAIGKLQTHEECFLCQDSLMLSSHLTINCGHNFHVSCIDTWTQRHRKCPACYLPVVR